MSEVWKDGRSPKVTCSARTISGVPCKRPPIQGGNVCRAHGGAAPQVRAKAQTRILMSADAAAAKLIEMIHSKKVDDRTKLLAVKDLLDRANLGGKQTIEVGVVQPRSFEDFVGDAVIDMDVIYSDDDDRPALPAAPENLDVVDADVVEEPPLMNRHDRLAFAEVERERRRAPVGLTRNPDAQAAHEAVRVEQEAEALSQAGSFEKERRYREAYARLMGTGTPREVAEREAQRYADAPPEPDRPRRRRTRSSEARYSR